MTPKHINVFFVNPQDGWAAVRYDKEGNQIGDGIYCFKKSWAIEDAQQTLNVTIDVYKKDGTFQ
jgi:hypothetical protein